MFASGYYQSSALLPFVKKIGRALRMKKMCFFRKVCTAYLFAKQKKEIADR